MLRVIHSAMPWRSRAKEEFLREHRERLGLIFARLDAALDSSSASLAKDLLRELL